MPQDKFQTLKDDLRVSCLSPTHPLHLVYPQPSLQFTLYAIPSNSASPIDTFIFLLHKSWFQGTFHEYLPIQISSFVSVFASYYKLPNPIYRLNSTRDKILISPPQSYSLLSQAVQSYIHKRFLVVPLTHCYGTLRDPTLTFTGPQIRASISCTKYNPSLSTVTGSKILHSLLLSLIASYPLSLPLQGPAYRPQCSEPCSPLHKRFSSSTHTLVPSYEDSESPL